MSEPENVYTQEATGLRACAHPASLPWSRSAEWMMMGRASARLGAGSAKSLTSVCVTSLGETAALLSCRTSAPSGEDVRAQRLPPSRAPVPGGGSTDTVCRSVKPPGRLGYPEHLPPCQQQKHGGDFCERRDCHGGPCSDQSALGSPGSKPWGTGSQPCTPLSHTLIPAPHAVLFSHSQE